MSTRKNPARQGTKVSTATQSQPTSQIDEPLASGDAVAQSPTARRRRGEPTSARMYQRHNSLQTQTTEPAVYDENGMPLPGRDPVQHSLGLDAEDADEPFSKKLIPPKRVPTAHTGQGQVTMDGRKPNPRPTRSDLYYLGVGFLRDNAAEGEADSMATDSMRPIPPDYNYRLTPPTNPLSLSSPFNPMELPQELRNPHGMNCIVQSTDQAYWLMGMRLRQADTHTPGGPGAIPGSTYANEESVDYATYSDARSHGPMHHQQTSPTSWQRTNDASAGTWPAQQSPTAVSRRWPQTGPGNQAQDQPGAQQQSQAHSTPPGAYRPQTGWTPANEQPSTAERRVTPPPSPPLWRRGSASAPGPSPQSAAAPPNIRPRDASWSQGDPARPPSHPSPSSGAPIGGRWTTSGPSPVTTANPATWGSHSMANMPSSSGGIPWQVQGAPSRSTGPLQHQPHPTIDGPSDNGMKWSASNSSTEATMHHSWQAPSEGNTTMTVDAANSAGNITNAPPGTRYSIDDSGRPTQVQTNPRAPWIHVPQMNNYPTTLPPDGRIQTPGGTGAMGGQAARQATTTAQMTGPYSASPSAPGYGIYPNRPGSIQAQPRPGEYAPVAGNEMAHSSQPDSMVSYRSNTGQGGVPPPPSVASGPPPPQGYTTAGGPLSTGNPYPSVPPATGTASYVIPRPGVASQSQQHQQPPPNAHGNMYPSIYTQHQQPPSQPQAPNANGSVYAPYTTAGAPPPVTYPANPGVPMGRAVTRIVPGPSGMQINAYSAMGPPHIAPSQDVYGRIGAGVTGQGGVDGFRAQ